MTKKELKIRIEALEDNDKFVRTLLLNFPEKDILREFVRGTYPDGKKGSIFEVVRNLQRDTKNLDICITSLLDYLGLDIVETPARDKGWKIIKKKK